MKTSRNYRPRWTACTQQVDLRKQRAKTQLDQWQALLESKDKLAAKNNPD